MISKRIIWLWSIGAVVIFVIMLAMNSVPAVYAQGNLTPTATLDPEISTLQSQIQAQATAISFLSAQLDLKKQQIDVQYSRDVVNPITIVLAHVGISGLVLGVSSYIDFKNRVKQLAVDAEKKARTSLGLAIARVDPTYFKIHIVGSESQAKPILERLKLSGFPEKNTYRNPALTAENLYGITIYLAGTSKSIS